MLTLTLSLLALSLAAPAFWIALRTNRDLNAKLELLERRDVLAIERIDQLERRLERARRLL